MPLTTVVVYVVSCLLLLPAVADSADVAVLTRGDRVMVEDHLVPGKLVLVDFYADWCGPCRSLEPRLRQLADRHPDQLALRKVDIVRWSSPVAKQYAIRSVPHLKLYGIDGRLLAEGNAGRVLAALDQRLSGGDGYSPRGETPTGSTSSGLGVPVIVALLIVAVVATLVGKKRQPQPNARPVSPPLPPVGQPASELWFVEALGDIEGPFEREELTRLARGGQLGPGARARRRGELEWISLDQALSETPQRRPRGDV